MNEVYSFSNQRFLDLRPPYLRPLTPVEKREYLLSYAQTFVNALDAGQMDDDLIRAQTEFLLLLELIGIPYANAEAAAGIAREVIAHPEVIDAMVTL